MTIRLCLFLGTALMLAGPSMAAAQSHLSGGGLGLFAEPLDARSRALGSVGTGLSGWHISPTDPAALAGIDLPSITASLQPSTVSTDGAAEAGGARFPVFGVAYPFGDHVATLQFGSFLEQDWEARVEREISVGGETVTARDRYESLGGIGQVRLGWATRIGEDVAVGVTVGSYIGSMERHFTRELDPGGVGPGVEPFRDRGRWRASGPAIAAGVAWDPSDLLRVSASVDWAGDLTLDPVAPTTGSEVVYPMPLTLRGGGTFTLTDGLALVVGVSRADWSGIDEALGGDAARGAAWSYGGGVEWSEMSLLGRGLPVRLGYTMRDLPFHFDGEPSEESSFSGGFGMDLSRGETRSVARLDLSLERGSRSAGVFSEDYWRTTVSMRLAGG
jgi:hypothetical protein